MIFSVPYSKEILTKLPPGNEIRLDFPTYNRLKKILPQDFSYRVAATRSDTLEDSPNVVFTSDSFRDFQEFSRSVSAAFSLPVTDVELYRTVVAANSKDIFVDGPLAFSLPFLQKEAPSAIRVSALNSPNARVCGKTPSYNSFYILPQTLKYYEPFVQTLEVTEEELPFYLNQTPFPRLNWEGSDCAHLIPSTFAFQRLDCGQLCGKRGCSRCRTEFRIAQLSDELKEVLPRETY